MGPENAPRSPPAFVVPPSVPCCRYGAKTRPPLVAGDATRGPLRREWNFSQRAVKFPSANSETSLVGAPGFAESAHRPYSRLIPEAKGLAPLHSRLATTLAVSILALAAVPATASAHRVSISPRFGLIGDDFSFKGRGWQPSRLIRWRYDEYADGTFEMTGRFRVGRMGRFELVWEGEDVVATHRMCFSQYDRRRRYRRRFFKCRSFTALQD
jgi:hypothetical protein